MVNVGIFPFKENSHGRAGNRTRDLMIRSQRLWPLDHEAGLPFSVCKIKWHVHSVDVALWRGKQWRHGATGDLNETHVSHLNIKINLDHTEIPSPYRAVNTLRLGYKNQSVNVV